MRVPHVTFACVVVSLLLALSSRAATLTMFTDKPLYDYPEIITLTIVGDPEGDPAFFINGSILYDRRILTVLSQTQTQHTSIGGLVPWLTGVLFLDTPNLGFADAFNQITGGLTPFTVDQLQVARIQFQIVNAPRGTIDFEWFSSPGNDLSLQFFGLTSAPGISVITGTIPEPASAALLALGLLGLAAVARAR